MTFLASFLPQCYSELDYPSEKNPIVIWPSNGLSRTVSVGGEVSPLEPVSQEFQVKCEFWVELASSEGCRRSWYFSLMNLTLNCVYTTRFYRVRSMTSETFSITSNSVNSSIPTLKTLLFETFLSDTFPVSKFDILTAPFQVILSPPCI